MPEINLAERLSDLLTLAGSYHVPLEGILTVPSIMKWCEEKGVAEENPFRAGKVVKNRDTGKYLVLLAESVPEDYVTGSLIPAMELRGLGSLAQSLKDPEIFARHLLLHELAHAIDESWSEEQCDRWAFAELQKNAI